MFAKVDLKLDPDQRAASSSKGRRVLVVAGPGSGKTRTAIDRIGEAIRGGVLPERICALTYTRAAAEEMRARVAETCDPSSAAALMATTFHGLGLFMARQTPEAFGRLARPDVWGEEEAFRAAALAARQCGKRVGPRATRENLLVDPRILASYENFKRARNALDFSDLERVLVSPDVSGRVARMFDVILFDEHQDANDVQAAFLHRLVEHGSTLFVVGDPRQAIYQWRGAVPEEFLALLSSGSFEVHQLVRNYRSGAGVVDIANRLAGRMGGMGSVLGLEPHGGETKVISNWSASDAEEAEAVVLAMEDRMRRFPDETCAILARRWSELHWVCKVLDRRGVSYDFGRGAKGLGDSAGAALRLAARLALDPMNDWAAECYASLMGMDEPAIERIRTAALGGGKHFTPLAMWQHRDSLFARSLAATWPGFGQVTSAMPPDGHGQADRLLMGIIPFIGERFGRDIAASLAKAGDEWVRGRRELGIPTTLELLVDDLATHFLSRRATKENQARLFVSSAHGAKGLEWDAVAVIGLTESHDRSVPSWPALYGGEPGEEDRRLFYVAATRARRFLMLSGSSSRFVDRNGGSFSDGAHPSRFFEEAIGYLPITDPQILSNRSMF